MSPKNLLWLMCLPLCAQERADARLDAQTAELRALVQKSPRLPLEQTALRIQPPAAGWALEMVSWVAMDPKGVIYLLQRGDRADPVIALNREGSVLQSWGRGMYIMPHASSHRSARECLDHRRSQFESTEVHPRG